MEGRLKEGVLRDRAEKLPEVDAYQLANSLRKMGLVNLADAKEEELRQGELLGANGQPIRSNGNRQPSTNGRV